MVLGVLMVLRSTPGKSTLAINDFLAQEKNKARVISIPIMQISPSLTREKNTIFVNWSLIGWKITKISGNP